MNDLYENRIQENAGEQYPSPSQADPPSGVPVEHPYYKEEPNPYPVRAKTRKAKKGFGVVVVALCFSILGSVLGGGLVLWAQHYNQPEKPEEPTEAETVSILQGYRENTVVDIVNLETGKKLSASQVYAANVGSTVGITTSITTNYFGFQTTSAASGSGFIITDDGYIITNFHVIENSDSISVSLYDGSTYEAVLIGYDESNDLAVLKIDAEELAPVILGDSDNLNVGDDVVAIGNPLGELTFSLTAGSISAKDREVTISSNVTMNLLQTDCAINSGNSGGALFNLYGEVIGVTNAKYSSSSANEASIDNIGFAIPINDIRSIVESIIEKGYYAKPYIGVSISDVSSESQLFGLPKGAAIQSVTEGSPAENAGLQVGDIVTQAGDAEITGGSDLINAVGDCQIGDTLALIVYRQGETISVTITIGEQIQSSLEEETEQAPQEQQMLPNFPNNFPWGMG